MTIRFLMLLFALSATAAAAAAELSFDQKPFTCTRCDAWNQPVAPYQLADNTWYVGTQGLSSLLVVDGDDLVLIDGGLPQSAALILDNVRNAGFDPEHIRWILNSHAHFDHAGGVAALARITGAQVAAGRRGVIALTREAYHPDDPQAGYGDSARFPSVDRVRAMDDGDRITVGSTTITAVASPGHAPGGMSWTWQSCGDDGCQNVVYLDSLNAVSTDDYRFSDHPDTLDELRGSIARLAVLPCDVAMSAHPDQLPVADDSATSQCAAYAASAGRQLDRRLEKERGH